jgi:hypothetical protein
LSSIATGTSTAVAAAPADIHCNYHRPANHHSNLGTAAQAISTRAGAKH